MAPVWFALLAGVRRRWRPLVSLALLLGLAGGVVLTAAAGARRTDTAYQRLENWADASQVTVLLGGLAPSYFTALSRLPQVAAAATAMQYNISLPVPGGLPDNQVEVLASADGSLGTSVDRVKVLEGRMFGPGTSGEALIDPHTAATLHLAPGDTLHLTAVPYYDAKQDQNPAKLQVPLTFKVAAVGVFDDQVVPTTGTSSEPRILLSPGFTRTALAARPYAAVGSIDYLAQAEVRLRPGASPAAFDAAAQALSSRYPAVRANGGLVFTGSSAQVAATERAIRPLAVALALFAALAGLIALAVIGQLLARQLTLDAAGYGVLSALGMTRGGLLALAAARLAMVTVAGAATAVCVAVAASPLMPIGVARVAEPQPGTDLDPTVLGIGFAARAGCPYGACTVTADQRPGDIRNYAAIRDTPLTLAAVLGVLAVGTLAHVLLTGARRRRRDLAVLKTLGFTRAAVLRTVGWEASALAAAALVAGIPLGVIAGRVAWALFAHATGIGSQATVNVALVLLAIPATLLLANVIAAWPGWTAARLRPAQVLRTE